MILATPKLGPVRSSAVFFLLLMLVFGGSAKAFAADPAIPSGHLRVHYHRTDNNYTGWTVYAFFNTTEDTGNYGGGPVQAAGTDSYGAYFDVGITAFAQEVGLIIHNPSAAGGDQKDPGTNEFVDPTTEGIEILGLLRYRQAI